MEYGKKFTQRLLIIVVLLLVFSILATLGLWLLFSSLFREDPLLQITFWTISTTLIISLVSILVVKASYRPLKTLSDAIVFAGHSSRGGLAPDTEKLKVGRELVTSLALQVYDLASMSKQSQKLVGTSETQNSASIFEHIGLPVFGIAPNQLITMANKAACDYFGTPQNEIIGKPFYDAVKLTFQVEETLEIWLNNQQANSINGFRDWDRVRLTDPDGNVIRQFDLSASFSKENQSGTETMLIFFDRTEQYGRDDQEISFVSLAVHELRTPLTIMKGYIEVFEDEVGPTLTPELAGFMHNMHASAQQLTAFVGNILNVARVEENQLVLTLKEQDWASILRTAVNDLALRASVQGKHIEVQIAEGLPPVAVDKISIHEVLNNLVDNAIKYSGNSDKILISTAINQDGMVQTSVQDYGIGIPSAVMPDLFQKFYRSHKSRIQISGTGLGLYLSKAIISAHDGNIWVRSKEGEGSVFTFTIQPFDNMKLEQANGEDGIIRGTHGWIKNHSLNRQ